MKISYWIFCSAIFFMVGELVIRLDQKTRFFDCDNVVLITPECGISEESSLLRQNMIPMGDSSLRIMVLGDSYIYGGGIDFNKNFSHDLKTLLKKSRFTSGKKVYVLDVSRPNNNNLDNYNTYFMYVRKFKPQTVILGYNLNDIKDNLEQNQRDTLPSQKGMDLPVKSEEKKNVLQRSYNFMWNSEILKFISKNFYNYLKSKGIIIPKTGFDEKISAYALNKPSWVRSKSLLTEMFEDANKQRIQYVVLLMPEIEMLQYPKLFHTTDTVIENYLKPFPNVTFVNGRDIFKGQPSEKYRLSKYDGHPNELGHMFMAKYMDDIFENKKPNLLLQAQAGNQPILGEIKETHCLSTGN